MIKVSEELLSDSVFNWKATLLKFARRIGAKEEEAFLIGDGEGKPTGIFDNDSGRRLEQPLPGLLLKRMRFRPLLFPEGPYRKGCLYHERCQ